MNIFTTNFLNLFKIKCNVIKKNKDKKYVIPFVSTYITNFKTSNVLNSKVFSIMRNLRLM